jgi:signal transduction histidine kinase
LLAELQSQAKKLRHEDLDQAIAAARQAVEIAAACDQKEAQAQMAWAQSLAGLGELFGQKGDYFQALQNLLHALDLVKAAPAWPLHGEILRETITVYTNLGEFPTALRYCLELNALAKGQGDFGWRATAFNWIAHVLMRMKNWRQAADYLERGLKVVDGHTDFESQAMLHINLCSSYTALGEHYLAVQSGQRGLALAQDAGHIQLEAESLYTLSQAYLAQGSHEQALDCFNECLAFCQANQLRAEMLRCQQGIAAIFEQSDRPAEALQQLEQALRLAEECGPKSAQYQVHRQMAEIYKALGQPEAALHHFEQFYLLYQAAQSEAVELRVKNLQAVHELAISRQEADLQRQKNLELQNLLDQQELLIDDLNAFAHTVAHDLKTPIAALSLSIELLGRVENSHLSQQGLEILNSASLASQRMNTITDELLILASVREQSIELQALDMAEIVTRVESRLQMMIAGQQARLVKPEQWPAALGYAPWIEEVWANYISNAIKYGGHPPQVRLGGDLLPGKQVQFWVCDNGKGLKAEEMRLLFQPFQRLSQVQTQGYGLGLPIVRRILEKLGGEVGVESQGIPGEGCKFTFILPAAPE